MEMLYENAECNIIGLFISYNHISFNLQIFAPKHQLSPFHLMTRQTKNHRPQKSQQLTKPKVCLKENFRIWFICSQ